MNLRSALLLLLHSTLASAALGSLAPLPPSSGTDGILVIPALHNLSSWNRSSLVDYGFVDGNPFVTPLAGTLDGYGRRWCANGPDLSQLHHQSGTVRIIALGSSPSWTGALGYSYSGKPQLESYTLAADCGTLRFGENAAVPLAYGETDTFDFWLDGATTTHSLFGSVSSPNEDRSSIRWLQDPLRISTFLPGWDEFADTDTWVVSIDEGPMSQRFAVQFFYAQGDILIPPAVPEASTMGGLGALLLLAVAVGRARARARRG